MMIGKVISKNMKHMIGKVISKNPRASEKYEHSGVVLGPQVNEWHGRQTSQ
jgi:hypothetical protein